MLSLEFWQNTATAVRLRLPPSLWHYSQTGDVRNRHHQQPTKNKSNQSNFFVMYQYYLPLGIETKKRELTFPAFRYCSVANPVFDSMLRPTVAGSTWVCVLVILGNYCLPLALNTPGKDFQDRVVFSVSVLQLFPFSG